MKTTKKGKKEGNRKKKEKKENAVKKKVKQIALRAQAKSRGDKVAVSWHDQSYYDMSSWWTKWMTTQKDETKDQNRAESL